MEFNRHLKRLVPMLAVLLAIGGIAVWLVQGGGGSTAQTALPIPGGESRITVEVLNVARVDGLARAVTGHLRREGVDVVSYGSVGDSVLDSTTIVIRRGDSAAAIRVRDALGFGRLAVEIEPSLLLDVSVLVGADAAARAAAHD